MNFLKLTGVKKITQHPNQNPTKLISFIIFAPIPLQVCPHTYTEFHLPHEKHQENQHFLHGSSGLLFHYCSSSSHQLRVEKLSKFPQNDKVAIKHGRHNLNQAPTQSRMQWPWPSPVWLQAPPGREMGTQSPCAGCLQVPQTHTANRCQTGL